MAEKEANNSVKNAILNARHSHSTSRSTCTEVLTAKQTENNKNETSQNETEILKKEIKSVKKDSIVSQIPTRRQFRIHYQNYYLKKTTIEPTQISALYKAPCKLYQNMKSNSKNSSIQI